MFRNLAKCATALFGVTVISAIACAYHSMAIRQVSAQELCNDVNPGCKDNVAVPCNNATCAKVSDLTNPDDIPECDDPNQTAVRYSATAATGWTDCVSQVGGFDCKRKNRVCANVYGYTGNPCTIANRCTSTATFQRCSDDNQPYCQ